ncbi:hypothetical protein V2J09_019466 [Rumex salicifolius]
MANSPSSSTNKQPEKPASNSPASKAPIKASPLAMALKAYWLPLTLFALSLFFQLVVLPHSYPPSHYDVLGIRRGSPIEEVKEAYDKLSSNWMTLGYVKIRYAYELLSYELWKRDYDLFCIDEQLHVMEEVKQLYAGESYSRVTLPLLDDTYSGSFLQITSEEVYNMEIDKRNLFIFTANGDDDDLDLITSNNFQSVLADKRPILIQVYSRGSLHSAQFMSNWKRIATLLGDIANTGVVEVGEVNLAAYFADKKATGQLYFRNGLPLLVAFPQGCRSSSCIARYEGELSVDAVTDWFSTAVLKLPRIPYYSKETLGPKFLAKSGHHKLKIIVFETLGMRATPLVRQIAKAYQDYASFAFVLWREEEFSFWWSVYDLESAPATVFLKDPGSKPVVHYGMFPLFFLSPVNSSWFLNAMEENKLHELAQLRTVTSMELGCDARGYSRAGADTKIWYCVVLIGRPSPDMNQKRDMLRKVQDALSSDSKLNEFGVSDLATTSLTAYQDKRLTFSWMDGEHQKNLCTFYLGAEVSFESCGPLRAVELDSSHIVMIRYMRNDTVDDAKVKRRRNSIVDALQEDVDPASQLVASYNGSFELPQILEWVSKIIKDGDTEKLPFYRTRAPPLVPENSDPLWMLGSGSILSKTVWIKDKIWSLIIGFGDLFYDPRVGPMFLLAALMSYGWILLKRSQLKRSNESEQSQEPGAKKRDVPKEWRNRGRIAPDGNMPPSMTDVEPRDSVQMPFSDSDSD